MPVVDKATGSASLLEKKNYVLHTNNSARTMIMATVRSFSFCLEIMNLAPPIISLNLKDETKQYCRQSSVPLDAIVYEPDQLHAEKTIASKHMNYRQKHMNDE